MFFPTFNEKSSYLRHGLHCDKFHIDFIQQVLDAARKAGTVCSTFCLETFWAPDTYSNGCERLAELYEPCQVLSCSTSDRIPYGSGLSTTFYSLKFLQSVCSLVLLVCMVVEWVTMRVFPHATALTLNSSLLTHLHSTYFNSIRPHSTFYGVLSFLGFLEGFHVFPAWLLCLRETIRGSNVGPLLGLLQDCTPVGSSSLPALHINNYGYILVTGIAMNG